MFSQQIVSGKTSPGPPVFKNDIVVIEFEGDGPLGIKFRKFNEDAYISSIIPGTVSSEYYGVEGNMKLIKIEDYHCIHISYRDITDLISLRWAKYSKIKITLERMPQIEVLLLNEECPIYTLLTNNNCEEYYNQFTNLGAKSFEDLAFIEYNDLVKMNIPEDQCKILFEQIKKISQVFSEADDV